MKRLLLRMSALSLVAVSGLIAIARAQWNDPPAGSNPSPQAASDPFANSRELANRGPSDPLSSDATNSSGSSVRFVSVQDFSPEGGTAPPRSVPSASEPVDGSAPMIQQLHQRNGSQPPLESAFHSNSPFGPQGGHASLAAATAPDISASQSPVSEQGGHSIDLGSPPAASPTEVAQAPATLEPAPNAAPLLIPPPATAPAQIPPAVYAPSASPDQSPPAAASQSVFRPTTAPPPAADAGPGGATANPGIENSTAPGIRIERLRPADPEASAAAGIAPAANSAPATAPARADAATFLGVRANDPLPFTNVVAAGPDAAVASGNEVHPDSKHVDGSQSPQLTIEKMAPAEVQVGKPARFELRVRNAGTAVAQGVEIHDAVPRGTQFVSSNPPTTQGPDGQLAWSLGELKPGKQTSVELELMPIAEGDIRSTATVTFRTDVSVHTLATRPRLVLQLTAPKQVLIGDDALMTVRISNPGTGTATGVMLSERVPRGLRHKAGGDLEFDVGTLKPGQSRQIELAMSAVEAGHVVNALQARGDAKLRAQARAEFDVVAPALSVAMSGPTRRYLERQATYTVAVSNPGTAPARDVELITELPKGMKFVTANNAGHYDPQTHTVTWNLEELPPSETGSVTLVAMPIEAGEQRMKIAGKARQGLSDAKEKTVTVEGLAAVTFDVRAADEAIEVGGETTYQIHVVNEGSMAAANLQITALFPPELKPLRAEGPGRGTVDRRTVQFEPLARLEPKGEATYHVRAQAVQPGDLRVKVQVQTDDMHQPVTKEENTRVYVDH